MEPELGHRNNELIQPTHVVGNGMVAQPPSDHTRQPSACLTHRVMSAKTKLLLDRRQRSAKPLATDPSLTCKALAPPRKVEVDG